MEHGRGVRRDPQSPSIPTPRFNQGMDPLFHVEGTYYQNGMMDHPEISDLGTTSWTNWNF